MWDAADVFGWYMWYGVAVVIHTVWELVENSVPGIAFLRKHFPRHFRDYKGDSLLNSVGDVVSFSCGFLWLAVVPHWGAAMVAPAFAAATAMKMSPTSEDYIVLETQRDVAWLQTILGGGGPVHHRRPPCRWIRLARYSDRTPAWKVLGNFAINERAIYKASPTTPRI